MAQTCLPYASPLPQAAIASLFDTAAITGETCSSTLGNAEFVQQQDTYKGAWVWAGIGCLKRACSGSCCCGAHLWDMMLLGLLLSAACSAALRHGGPPQPPMSSHPPTPLPRPAAAADAALDPRCMLLGREFSRHAAKWVHRVYRSCTAGLHVLACSERLTERDNTWWQ